MKKDNKKKKKNKWVRPRHKVVRDILDVTLGTFTKIKYGIKIDKLPKSRRGQYLVLYNHQTLFDQFFVGMAFRDPVYYLASEDLFSNGFTSSLIKYLVAPISIRKQTTDVSAIMNCLRVVREGGTIAIAPEGNRTYSGKTEYINPSIATMAKQLKLPIAIFKIEGGYGVHPRWSDVVRRGKMHAYISKIITPEEIKAMSEDEICRIICSELDVNEANANHIYKSKKTAEYLERALYTCPACGMAKLESRRDIIKCTKCGLSAKYTETTELCGVDCELPFRFVNDWYEYQKDIVNKISPEDFTDTPIFTDTAAMYRVIPNKKKFLESKCTSLELYSDKVKIDGKAWTFTEISAVVVLGKNKLNIYYEGNIHQFKGDKRFNALKYVNIYQRYKNVQQGECDSRFLGI